MWTVRATVTQCKGFSLLPLVLGAALGVLALPIPRARAAESIENTSYTGEKTTIRYALWGGPGEVVMVRQACEAFVQRHPEIRLEVSVYPWGRYWTKIQTQAASGLAPDVITVYDEPMGIWISRGAFAPLDEFIRDSSLDLAGFYSIPLQTCTWDGKLYSMPYQLTIRTLVYSIDKLEERGIPPAQWPSADKAMSWEEFKELAAKLTLRNPDGTYRQYGMTAGKRWNYAMSQMYGGAFLDRPVNPSRPMVADDERLATALIEVLQTQYADRCTIGQASLGAAAVETADTLLLSPRYAMGITGPWALATLHEAGVRFGLAPMPRGSHCTQLTGFTALSIYSGSKHPKQAWEFIRFMISEETQPMFGRKLLAIPALISASDSLVHNDYGIEGCEAFLYDLASAQPKIVSANTYVPATLNKWLEQIELTISNECESRSRALRHQGGAAEAEHRAFVEGMNGFIDLRVRQNLAKLDRDLNQAFKRGERAKPGLLNRVVLPAFAMGVFSILTIAYIRRIRRDKQREPAATGGRYDNFAGYMFVLPWLTGFACFMLIPILVSLLLSFTEWNMIRAPIWLGVQNYVDLLRDSNFWIGLERTLSYSALVIPISFIGGLILAGLLTCNIRGASFFKSVFYFPSLFMGAGAAVLWVNMFDNENGVINRLLSFIGLGPVSWLDANHAFVTVVLMNVFWVGGSMVIYYAGMKQIPRSLYEAAEIDGAGPVRRFLSITLPMLSPVLLFTVITTTVTAFRVFTPALFFAQSSSTIGEPGDALRFYVVNIYDEAFNNLRMGRACCYAVILFGIIFAITMIQIRLSRRFVHVESS